VRPVVPNKLDRGFPRAKVVGTSGMSQLPRPLRQPPASAELAAALGACRRAFVAIALFSGMSNILMLTGSLFMLEVYDRVIPSRSIPTLVALLVLAGGLYAAQGIIDAIRSRILVRIGNSLDETLSLRVYDAIVRLPLTLGVRSEGAQPIRDLDTVRGFLSGTGPIALFDLPWLPIYLGMCFLFHTYIGLAALSGAIILVALTLLTEMLTRRPTRSATQFAAARSTLMEASRRNAEAITAMGVTARIAQHWSDLNRSYVASTARASDVAGGFGAMSKVLRMMLQSALLAVGAWLVIHQESTSGIIIAGSILGSRALAPVDLAIANWRGFVAARQGWKRLSHLFTAAGSANGAATAGKDARGAERGGSAAGRAEARLPGRELLADRRQGAGRDRADGVGKVVARAPAGRGLDAGTRQRPHRRRHARSMVAGGARPARRLSAAGRRAVQRHRGAEHRPLRGAARSGGGHRRRPGGRRSRAHHQSRRRL
jgi:ABC-type multidrug transport system fused ATPase/permease subunit